MTAAAPLRVCHISLTLRTGGLERLLVDFARFHDRSRVEPEFLALRDDLGQPAADIRALGCPVHRLPAGSAIARFLGLRRLLNERRIDVVHTHNTPALLLATLPARCSRASVLLNTRHGQGTNRSPRVDLAWRALTRLNHCIVAVSHDTARLTRDRDRVPSGRLATIWNGIDPGRFVCRGPAPGGQPVAITVCRLTVEKDLPVMLRAIQLAADRLPGLRLRVVGDGELMTGLVDEARQLGLADRVEFLGHRTDVPELLARSAFYLCSSWTEGLSLTLLEAMAVGLPVIATDVGGNREIVVDGETGQLVPARDPAALADAIASLGAAPGRWAEMGLAGRRRVEEHFDIRRMVADYEALYRRLLEG